MSAIDLRLAVKYRIFNVVSHIKRLERTFAPGETYDFMIEIPKGFAWIEIREKFGDISLDTFQVTHRHDGISIYENLKIGLAELEWFYAVPSVVWREICYEVKNLDTTTSQPFSLLIEYAEVPMTYIHRMRKELGL